MLVVSDTGRITGNFYRYDGKVRFSTSEDMAKLMDHSRDGSTGKLLTKAGYTEPGNCIVDLRRSHMMVSQ